MMLAILQARFSSTRLPGKVFKSILNQPMLLRQIERIQRAKCIDKLIVATSIESSDDQIMQLCADNDIDCYRGSLNDVLDRFYQAAKHYQATHIVRLTGDCPLTDPAIIDEVITHHTQANNDYTSNTLVPTYPDGLDVEVMKFNCLVQAHHEAKLVSQREHVTSYFYTQPQLFKLGSIEYITNLGHLRWTVDNQQDFDLITQIYQSLYEKNPDFSFLDILNLVNSNPALQLLNVNESRNTGYQHSLLNDVLKVPTYESL